MSRLRTLFSNTSQKHNYLPTTSPFANVHINLDEYASYPLLTAKQLRRHKEPPKRVRMLARDYVDDSLYNPHYGYFSRRVEIVGSTDDESGFAFGQIASATEFDRIVYQRYRGFLDKNSNSDDDVSKGKSAGEEDGLQNDNGERSVWHTPTELFKPWYTRALARCIVSNYRLTLFPYADLTIYELGAGNGTLMRGILDYLANEDPEVYERTRYHIVEVSPRLAAVQRRRTGPHAARVQVHEHDALDWSNHDYVFRGCDEKYTGSSNSSGTSSMGSNDKTNNEKGAKKIREPVYVLAIELLDNLAHDVVRYDMQTCEAYQATITVDPDGDFHEAYTPVTDGLIQRFLDMRKYYEPTPPVLPPFYYNYPKLRRFMLSLPFAPNMSPREFIPTRAMLLLETLESVFAQYQPIFADFSHLPQSVPGYQGPVVQTRIQDITVPCETYLVATGYFDIFYPTDFVLLRSMIRHSKRLSSPSSSSSPSSTQSKQSTSSFSLFSPLSLLRNSTIYPFSRMVDYNYNPSHNNNADDDKMYASIGDSILPRPKTSSTSTSSLSSSSENSTASQSTPLSERVDFFTPSRRLGVSLSSSTPLYEEEEQDEEDEEEGENDYERERRRLRRLQRRRTHNDNLAGISDNSSSLNNRSNSTIGSVGNAGVVGPMRIMSHREFMKEFGEVHETVLKDGSNPMMYMYSNQKILF